MNAKQRRRSIRYWKYSVCPQETHWSQSIERCEWLEKNFGRNEKGRRYCWAGWSPTCYQFHNEQDYMFFVLRWGTE